ncbi:hypothetical protein ABKW00_02020 [Enterobacter hormaechei]
MPRGLISGQKYSVDDIHDNYLYLKMKGEPLIDNDDCIVIPVRNEKSPHFRKIGNVAFGTRLGRAENDQTHNKCVNSLYEELRNPKITKITITTYVFNERQKEEQVIFSTLNESKYGWFKEGEARIAFEDSTYIQPDIGGREINKFFPRSIYPNIIIEVIRTHSPDKETFEKLVELSKVNHHVYFYFIGSGRMSSGLNNFTVSKGELKIRVSHYLIGGEVYKNGNPVNIRNNKTFDVWYNELNNGYFTFAKEIARKEKVGL